MVKEIDQEQDRLTTVLLKSLHKYKIWSLLGDLTWTIDRATITERPVVALKLLNSSVLSKSSGYRTMVLGYDVTDPREDVRLKDIGRI